MYSQSFFITQINDTISCENISVSNKFLNCSAVNAENDSKIELEKVSGYYLERENAFFEKRKFSERSGFLGLGKNLEETDGFSELIIEGKIKAYRGEKFTIETAGNRPSSLNAWFLEKDTLFEKVFTADFDSGFFRFDGASFGYLNREVFESVISDDQIAIDEFKEIKKNHGSLNQILKIINDYNSRAYKYNSEISETKIKPDFADITVFRDMGKEHEDLLNISVNGIQYKLDRNSKIKLNIPTKTKSQICIENSINKNCMIISSSNSFPKYYRLKLDKKREGSIIKVNGNSSYYKTRLEYYDKKMGKQ
jgi:hypothetical protein